MTTIDEKIQRIRETQSAFLRACSTGYPDADNARIVRDTICVAFALGLCDEIERLQAENARLRRVGTLTAESAEAAKEAGVPYWTWEPHGDGWALYYGRTPYVHGLNKLTVKNDGFDWGGEELRETIARLLNELAHSGRPGGPKG